MNEKQTQELIDSMRRHIEFLEKRLAHTNELLERAMEMCKNLMGKLK